MAAVSWLIAMGRESVDSAAGGAPGDASLAGGVETVGGAGFGADASSPFSFGSAESEVSARGRGDQPAGMERNRD